MFGHRKARAAASPVVPPLRAALLAVNEAVARARSHFDAAEATVERLKAVIAAEGPAQAAVRAAIAADRGVALAGAKPEIAALLASAESAARSAAAARDALPGAERELAEAGTELARLNEHAKREAIDAVLIAEAEHVGTLHAETFAKLMGLYERLLGIDRALDREGRGTVGATPIEIPRLPYLRSIPTEPAPMLQGGTDAFAFSPYLRQWPRDGMIRGHAMAWTAARERLAGDPLAEIAELVAPYAVVRPAAPPEYQGSLLRLRTDDPAHAIPPNLVEINIGNGATALVPAEPQRDRPPMRTY
jgi:hypothetical protein